MNRTQGRFFWYFLMLACVVVLCGCSPTNTPLVRFQHVPIPTYDMAEYEALLLSDEPEIRYNAIANLIPYAAVYARTLTPDERSDTPEPHRGTHEALYAQAQYVFTTILETLRSNDDSLKAASFMFLAEFAPFYAEKKALFATVSQVHSRDVRTQYEQLNTLIALVEPDTDVDRTMIIRFLKSRTWRIRSMVYTLLSYIPCDDLHPRILRSYRNTAHDYDKLVMLQAFKYQYGTAVFELLKDELLVSTNPQIQRLITEMLPAYHDAGAVSQWIVAVYPELSDEVVVLPLVNQYADALSTSHGVVFFEELLATAPPDFMPLVGQSLLIESLHQALEYAPTRSDLISLRENIQAVELLQQSWDAYANERAQAEETLRAENAIRQAILPHYTKLLNTFLEDTRRLLAEFGMEAEEIEVATEDMRALLQLFHEVSEE